MPNNCPHLFPSSDSQKLKSTRFSTFPSGDPPGILNIKLKLLLHSVLSLLCCLTCTVRRSRCPLLDCISSLLPLIPSLCAALSSTDSELVEEPLNAVLKSSIYTALWGGGAIAKVICITTSGLSEFVGGATLIIGDSVRIEIGLQVGIRPGIKRRLFGRISSRREVGSYRSVIAST